MISNLLTYIEKEKHTDSLIDKLCDKLKGSSSEIEWRNIAYCLSQLKYSSERTFLKMKEKLDCYKDKLQNAEVNAYFYKIAEAARKIVGSKPEFKEKVDEFEKYLTTDEEQLIAIKNK